jgi:LysM domain
MPVSYIVNIGDSLSSIARRHGIKSWRELYNHPDNAGLRSKRPNPNVIFPGDVVIIPQKGSLPSMSASVTTPAAAVSRSCELSPTSTFSAWPAELIRTLCRSYQSHGSENRYLDNSFWGGEPSNLEEALARLGGPGQHAVKWVYDRASKVIGLWSFIRFIHNVWASDSHGFAFTCADKTALRTFLDASPAFCRDIAVMMSDHQALGPNQCWREVVSGTAGLHICIPRGDTLDQTTVAGEANMHIDPKQIVTSKDSDGTCSYSLAGSIDHGRDVGAGVIRRWTEQRMKELGERLDEAGKFWQNEPKGPKW